MKSKEKIIKDLIQENHKGMIISEVNKVYCEKQLEKTSQDNTENRMQWMKNVADMDMSVRRYQEHIKILKSMLKEEVNS